jgi:hypothetical protein
MEYPRYHGNYMGIVVQNNDPQYRGRVKVFVPHITPTVYKNWIENSDQQPAVDRVFKFIGSNVGSDLTNIIDDLKLILPWAEVASPVAGESSAGRYHASSKLATTSDGSNFTYLFGNSATTAYPQNSDNIAEKPGHIFDMATVNLSDAFNNPQITNVNNVNKLSYNYTPECYSNSGKGSFAVPNVGSHVWVFFNAGDPLYPVVFAVSHGASEWSSIYEATVGQPGLDYPGEWENTSISSGTINAETYRNKYVINQKGGTLAFVNTDNREILKLTHYSGSFKEFNNQANIELATNNDQKLVLGDSFQTIRGTRNEFTQRDYDNVIAGDHYRKVGDLNAALYAQWKSIMDPIADIKQLFDIRRTTGVHESVAKLLKLNGTGQVQTGNPALCPVCAGGSTTLAINNSFKPGYRAHGNPAQASVINGDPVGKKNLLNIEQWGRGVDNTNPQDLLKFISNSQSSLKSVGTNVSGIATNATKALQNLASGALSNVLTGNISGLLNAKYITGLAQSFVASVPQAIVPGLTEIVGTDGSALPNRPGYPAGKACPACGGTGMSPSSFNGVWAYETKKIVELPQMMLEAVPQLAKLEAQMGRGGSEIIEITKHKVETIGTVMNDWGAVRIDPLGKMEPAYVQVHPGATLTIRKPSPLIEQVQVDDLPGGTYSLNVCNRYNVLVGAGGLNLKSYGVVNLVGAMTNVTGEQVNIGSANEVNIDGGKRLSLVGDIVHIKQRNNEQVLLDGSVGIVGNLYVKGGIYVEGNLAAQATDTPQRKRQTDPISTSGGPVPNLCTGVSIPVDTGGSVPDKATHELKPGGGQPLYMGYSDLNKDKKRPIVGIPKGTIIGHIEIGDLQVVGTGNLGAPVYSTNKQRIPVKILDDTVANIQGCDIGEGLTLGGTGKKNLSLRGLPPEEVKKLITATNTPFSGGAPQFPIMNFGTGAHADSHVMAKHTHSYDEGENGSHYVIRQKAIEGLAATSNTDFEDISTAPST